MTHDELVVAWKNRISEDKIPLTIKHKNHRTVEFYPLSYEESVFHKFSGYWICLQTMEPVVQDTIKIKKADLKDWNIV